MSTTLPFSPSAATKDDVHSWVASLDHLEWNQFCTAKSIRVALAQAAWLSLKPHDVVEALGRFLAAKSLMVGQAAIWNAWFEVSGELDAINPINDQEAA